MNFIKDAKYVSRLIMKEISRVESLFSTSNSMVIGDFNANPFEDAMVQYDCFNAVMSKDIADRKVRKISGQEYPYFYNPMWSFFGDLSSCSPGTYFFHANSHDNHFRWNMLDQVIMRPNLIPFFNQDSIRIINEDGINQLKLSKTSKNHSDHYPIFCNFVF